MREMLLELKNLSVEYKTIDSTVKAVNGLNLTLKKGETLGLVGETGAGKTTTALSIMQLLPEGIGKISNGTVFFEGVDLSAASKKEMRSIRGEKIAMIFQDPMTSLNPVLTVGDQIGEMLEIHCQDKEEKKHIPEKVDALLEMVGIPAQRKGEYPHQFSGGMKQRVVIAMALACEPTLLIADEPTTALDVTIQAQVLDMMQELKERLDTSMLLITHDLGVVASMCDSVAVMYAGHAVEYGTLEQIFDSPMHPYTIGLFNAIPDLETKTHRLIPIEGLMPNPAALPEGCCFHPRCTKCMEICRHTPPPELDFDGHHVSCHLFSEKKEEE